MNDSARVLRPGHQSGGLVLRGNEPRTALPIDEGRQGLTIRIAIVLENRIAERFLKGYHELQGTGEPLVATRKPFHERAPSLIALIVIFGLGYRPNLVRSVR